MKKTARNIRIISAGAGSGKTYRLVEELFHLIDPASAEPFRPEGIVATTFTKKAASELIERIRQKLLEKGQTDAASRVEAGLIGTVHSVCGRLLQRFAFEAGISPAIEVIGEEDQATLFHQALSSILDERVETLEQIRYRFGMDKSFVDIDWRNIVLNMVDAARSNNLSPRDIKTSAKKSIDSLLHFFPAPLSLTVQQSDKKLFQLVETTLKDIEEIVDDKKNTHAYLEFLRGIHNTLRQKRALRWSDWVKLANNGPSKKCAPACESLQGFAEHHLAHPRLQEDVRQWITLLFELAAESLASYDDFKKQRGLLDYSDLETQTLAILDKEEVCEHLREEMDLLFVDEFQDTSPIQLAIFLKLAQLAKKTIWVGDPKQSIYAFRGADPILIAGIVAKFGIQKGDILTHSYRSREELVLFANSCFVPAFAETNAMPEEQVSLLPVRSKETEDGSLNTALQHWAIPSKNKDAYFHGLAVGINKMLHEKPTIRERESNTLRAVQPGDIALLCRSNADCSHLAAILNGHGIQVALAQSGLVNTMEARLTLAVLRRLIDPKDTLAVAEIIVLTADDAKPETWLEERLRYVQENKPDRLWQQDHPVIQKLLALENFLQEYSPAEMLEHVIEIVDMRRLVLGWGNQKQRLGNLEALRGLARKFEESCLRFGQAATLSGFILWLHELNEQEEDHQGMGMGEFAVNVLTYHKAKGLEWPVVFLLGLEKALRERVWGLTVMDDRKSVDIEAPLEGRWLRYWPWPFGQTKKNTGLQEKIVTEPLYNEAVEQALAEELRLFYVGVTRARDYLVFPVRVVETRGTTPTAWPDRMLGLGNQELSFSVKEGEAAVSLNDIETPVETRLFSAELTVTGSDSLCSSKRENGLWLAEREGRKAYDRAFLNPSLIDRSQELKISSTRIEKIGAPVALNSNPDGESLGNALHAFLAIDPTLSERESILERLLTNFGVSGAINVEAYVNYVDTFYAFLQKRFAPMSILRECPLQMRVGGQIVRGNADLLLEMEQGWVIVDHKTYPGTEATWGKKATQYADQLFTYAEAVKAATGKPVVATCIHFTLGGGWVELGIEKLAMPTKESPMKEGWSEIHANVVSSLQDLVAKLAQTPLPVPEVEYYDDRIDGELFAELAWVDTTPPVAILSGEQGEYVEKWEEQGWDVIISEQADPSENSLADFVIAKVQGE